MYIPDVLCPEMIKREILRGAKQQAAPGGNVMAAQFEEGVLSQILDHGSTADDPLNQTMQPFALGRV